MYYLCHAKSLSLNISTPQYCVLHSTMQSLVSIPIDNVTARIVGALLEERYIGTQSPKNCVHFIKTICYIKLFLHLINYLTSLSIWSKTSLSLKNVCHLLSGFILRGWSCFVTSTRSPSNCESPGATIRSSEIQKIRWFYKIVFL